MSYEESRARAQARARLEGAMNARMDQLRRRQKMNGAGKVISIVLVAIVAVVIIILAVTNHYNWEASCEKRGGHVASHVNQNSDRTYYCLNDNGGIIDIR